MQVVPYRSAHRLSSRWGLIAAQLKEHMKGDAGSRQTGSSSSSSSVVVNGFERNLMNTVVGDLWGTDDGVGHDVVTLLISCVLCLDERINFIRVQSHLTTWAWKKNPSRCWRGVSRLCQRRTMDNVCAFTSRFFQAATSRRRKPRVKSAKMFSMDGFNYPNLCVDFHSVVK